MGLALADIYLIRKNFAHNSDESMREERLQSLLHKPRGDSSRSYPKQRIKQKTLMVALTWQHYDIKKKRYSQVRETKGGGRRFVSINRIADIDAIQKALLDIFFPNGKSRHGQYLANYSYYITDFALQTITPTDGQIFTLENHLNANSLKQAKFTLFTKQKKRFEPHPRNPWR